MSNTQLQGLMDDLDRDQTPIERVEIFRETLDKLILNMKDLLCKLTPLLKRIISIIGTLFLIKTFVDLIPAGGIYTLYQRDKGSITEKELEDRFLGGYITWGVFWIIVIILASYILGATTQKFIELQPEINIISTEISQLTRVTLELGKDFSRGAYAAAQVMSQPAAQKYINQPSARQLAIAPAANQTRQQVVRPANSMYRNMPATIEEVE
jgi:hypothetical protein